MKTSFSILFMLASLLLFSQDSIPEKKKKNLEHEFGINATMLLKQVFNISNVTLTTLPYDVTYKLISKNKKAFRAGLGLDLVNQKVTTTSSTTGSSIPGPDEGAPTYNNSSEIFLRVGMEKRYRVGKRVIAYVGLDLVGMYKRAAAQTAVVFNNLPNSYNYSRTKIVSTGFEAGLGPVAGVELKLGKRISIFTEVPFYLLYTAGTEKTDNYSNQLDFSGNYVTSSSSETIKTSGAKFNLTLPVTLYLALKF